MTRTDPITLSIIIISYNTRDYLLGCLHSVEADPELPLGTEVIVVDNGSRDDSIGLVHERFPQVRLIETGRNLGFAKANNLGMQVAQGQFLLLLNSDTVVRPGALATLVGFLKAEPDAAVVGPRLLNVDGSRQLSCYRFPTPARAMRDQLFLTTLLAHHPRWGDYRRWAHDEVRPVDFVIGAAFLVRRSVVNEIGLLDEGFFMYAEETDWCFRMNRAGFRTYFTPDAQIIHYGGASGKSQPAQVFAESSSSQHRYFRKHYGVLGAATLRVSLILGALLRIPLYAFLAVASPTNRANALITEQTWRDILCWNLGFWQTPGLRPDPEGGPS